MLEQINQLGIKATKYYEGAPSIELFSIPQLNVEKQEVFLKKARAIKLENTKIVDLPMLITINSNLGDYKDFGVDMLHITRAEAYKKATLKEKYELNKHWAINEVLPVLAAYEAKTEEKFAGVKGFGTAVSKIDITKPLKIEELTSGSLLPTITYRKLYRLQIEPIYYSKVLF